MPAERHSIEYLDDGLYFVIRPRLESGRQCFDVLGGSVVDGAKIVQHPCHRHYNQQWSAWSPRGGQFNIRNRKSGKCIQRERNGSLLEMPCNQRDGRQRFKLN